MSDKGGESDLDQEFDDAENVSDAEGDPEVVSQITL